MTIEARFRFRRVAPFLDMEGRYLDVWYYVSLRERILPDPWTTLGVVGTTPR